jgi:hypothetical protein
MLNLFHALGRRLHRARSVLWALAAGAALLFAAAVLVMDAASSQGWLLGCVTVLLWCISALSVAYGFSGGLPTAEAGAGWFRRLRVTLARAYLWLMALLMTVASVGVLWVSLRSIGIALRGG